VPYTLESLPPEDAKRMLAAGEAMADSLGIPYNIAVVDAGGHLVAFTRQDGGLIGSIDLAIDKATTSRSFDKSTADWQPLRNPASPCSAYRKVMPEKSSSSAEACP